MREMVESLLEQWECGPIDRRHFLGGIAVAAAGAAVPLRAAAKPAKRTFKVLAIDHIAYHCPDPNSARDFYRDLLGMRPGQEDPGRRVELNFGTSDPNLAGFMVVYAAPAAEIARPARSEIETIAYRVDGAAPAQIVQSARAMGHRGALNAPNAATVEDPFGYPVQLVGGRP